MIYDLSLGCHTMYGLVIMVVEQIGNVVDTVPDLWQHIRGP